MEEIWKPIVGYEDLYEISSFGNVRSLDKYVNCKNNSKRLIKGKVISQFINHGYKIVDLTKNGQRKHCRVHRLVAQAFIPNYDNKEDVNHIDGNKTNNRIENLEWCTRQENIIHALENGLNSSTNYQYAIKVTNKKIYCYETNEIYNSMSEASSILNVPRSYVWRKCHNKTKDYKGYTFKIIE